jgi:hypothetical protein
LFFELVQIWQAGTNSLVTAVTLRLNDTRFAIAKMARAIAPELLHFAEMAQHINAGATVADASRC